MVAFVACSRLSRSKSSSRILTAELIVEPGERRPPIPARCRTERVRLELQCPALALSAGEIGAGVRSPLGFDDEQVPIVLVVESEREVAAAAHARESVYGQTPTRPAGSGAPDLSTVRLS